MTLDVPVKLGPSPSCSAATQDVVFAPMVDVARDPRWGRACEGPGEDPFVAASFARAKTRGFQRGGIGKADAVAACLKHFVGYGAVRAGREYAPSDIPPLALRETYLPPFEAGVREGAATIMPALNALDGRPMTVHRALLQGWLRERAGFDGIVISDYGAIRELIRHGVARGEPEAAALGIKAGCDVDMMGYAYVDHLAEAVARGLCSEAEVDVCVRRVLVFKQRLGLFDDPFHRCHAVEPKQPDRVFAREAARRSLVLLKNEGALIPVAPRRLRIAVVGPLGDAPREMVGSWAAAADPSACVSVLDGLRAAYPEAVFDCAAGVGIESNDTRGIDAAVEAARHADLVVLCVGEGAALNGEATSRTDLDLPGHQRRLAEAVLATGTPTIAIVFCGRPPIVPWLADKADALICAWMLGTEAGDALADVIRGKAVPTGRLAMTWPRSMGQVPIFYGDMPNGRTFDPDDHYTSKYLDCANEPLFPFGHGLSTTRFALSDLRAGGAVMAKGKPLAVRVAVTNVGERAGETTIFLFVRKPSPAVVRPSLQLRRFGKIALERGASGEVGFELAMEDVAFPRDDDDWVVEPGPLEIFIGQSAAPEGLLSLRAEVEGKQTKRRRGSPMA